MIKQTVNYKDFNGVERTEDLYFNLSKKELIDMEFSKTSFSQKIKSIVDSNDNRKIFKLFEEIVEKAYGVKSPDGKYFTKNKEELYKFKSSAAYDVFFMQLLQDEKAAVAFVNGLLPKED